MGKAERIQKILFQITEERKHSPKDRGRIKELNRELRRVTRGENNKVEKKDKKQILPEPKKVTSKTKSMLQKIISDKKEIKEREAQEKPEEPSLTEKIAEKLNLKKD